MRGRCRPIGDIHRPLAMLQSQPALPTFAADTFLVGFPDITFGSILQRFESKDRLN